MPAPTILKRRRTYLIGIPVLLLVLAVGGPWVYINLIQGDPEKELSFSDLATATTVAGSATTAASASSASTGGVEGTWTVASGSQAGYRVPETLLGQKTEAVGRTTNVTGSLTIAGTQLTAATVTVDLASVASDSDQRDSQFQGRIMSVSTYPKAVFTLTSALSLGSAIPADGTQVTYEAKGTMAMHGATKDVTATLVARRNGAAIEVTGTIPVTFADYGISNPSFAGASVGDTGTIEFVLAFARS